MKPILKTANGAWFEIETIEDAGYAQKVSRTGIGWGFSAELSRCKEGLEIQRHYLLLGDDGLGHVVVRAESADTCGVQNAWEGTLAVGFGNSDPWISHATDIADLSEAIAVAVEPSNLYAGCMPSIRGKAAVYTTAPNGRPDGTAWLDALDANEQEVVLAAMKRWLNGSTTALSGPEADLADRTLEVLAGGEAARESPSARSARKIPKGAAKVVCEGLREMADSNYRSRIDRNMGRIGRVSILIDKLKGKKLVRGFAVEPQSVPAP